MSFVGWPEVCFREKEYQGPLGRVVALPEMGSKTSLDVGFALPEKS